ncbi:MAG: hypothetical protein DMG19_16780 [Acidobacteria bacterium]|nr:MAG: hypothetical protein DMG19_16780 [Acidobacteriota bacterium]
MQIGIKGFVAEYMGRGVKSGELQKTSLQRRNAVTEVDRLKKPRIKRSRRARSILAEADSLDQTTK